MTSNSHHANASHKVSNKIPEEVEEAAAEAAKAPQATARKEKSVLQSKLTKLAIQIGYGGKILLGLVRQLLRFAYVNLI